MKDYVDNEDVRKALVARMKQRRRDGNRRWVLGSIKAAARVGALISVDKEEMVKAVEEGMMEAVGELEGLQKEVMNRGHI